MSKVLHIVLDGCRPDGLAQATTPHLDSLWQTGAYSWRSQSIMPSISLPCHTSMFRAILPEKHGITENLYVPTAGQFPSVIDVAADKGLHTAMFYSWGELRDLAAPPSLHMSWCRNAHYGQDNDRLTAQAAADYLTAHQPDYCFLYLGDVDIFGHLFGWMSPDYLHAIEMNDRAVGELLSQLEAAGLRDQYTILVQSDHGGHEKTHGTDSPEDMTPIWFISGPGIKRGHEIQADFDLRATAATIAQVLDLTRPDVWDGQPVYDAFE
ncbi:MAG: alkaline phosphatase family protein [Anaerolineae bacterium]|nr:alkaline phosphatase family protein [Anaerolineae bacterium]